MTELTEQEIQANKEEILCLLRSVNRPGIEDLIDYLENKSDFFTAPASTRFHGNFRGGLAAHSKNCYYRLKRLYENELPPGTELSPEVLESCCLQGILHDLCKCNVYTLKTKNVKNPETGKWEQVPAYFFEDKLPYGHGEKSVYMISGFIRLSRLEAFSIRYHMLNWVDDNKSTIGDALSCFPEILHLSVADMQSSYLDGI